MQFKHPLFVKGEYLYVPFLEAIKISSGEELWSTRLGSGLLGYTRCAPGRKGPKNEVLLAVGDEGLEKLVDLGFVGCGGCRPAYKYGNFWDIVSEKAQERHGVKSLEEFKELPVDTRRINWEELYPITGLPKKLYIPPRLEKSARQDFRKRLTLLDPKLPQFETYERKRKKK